MDEIMSEEELAAARKWAEDNPHLSFHLRKALSYIDYFRGDEVTSLSLKVTAAREVC